MGGGSNSSENENGGEQQGEEQEFDRASSMVAGIETTVSALEKAIEPVLQADINELKKKISPLEGCKLDLLMAYAMNSLFWVYLSSKGVNPKTHPVMQDLERIRSYMKRLESVENGGSFEEDASSDAASKKNQPRVDKAAARRFIKAGLSGEQPLPSTDQDASGKKEKGKGKGKIGKGKKDKEKKEKKSGPRKGKRHASEAEAASENSNNNSSKKRSKKSKKGKRGKK